MNIPRREEERVTDATPDGPESTDDGRGDGDRETSRAGARHERLTAHPRPGPGTSLRKWYRARNPLRVVLNYVVIVVCRVSPSLRLKRWLLRRIGVTVGSGVAWGLESTPDVFWPDLVTVEDDAVVGYDATILCHEFLVDEYRTGGVVIGERALIGAGAVVLPGVEVGAEARVAANSLVASDVPPGETVAGVPATTVDGDERDRTGPTREPGAGG
jgi:acetyltransferase-like isoleucine patch superfamily enzyme